MQQWRTSAGELGQKLNEIYRPNLVPVVSNLVHLESLVLGQADLDPTLLNNLTDCIITSIRHLSLPNITTTEVIPIMDSSVVWPLETLDIKLGLDFDTSRDSSRSTSSLESLDASIHTIPRLCRHLSRTYTYRITLCIAGTKPRVILFDFLYCVSLILPGNQSLASQLCQAPS
jgi:hypothetical protein